MKKIAWVVDGRGFVPESISGSQAIGVLGMRERAGMFNGTVNFLSKPGKGTTVRVRMPRGQGQDREGHYENTSR